MAVYSSVLDLIGSTPMLQAQGLDTGVCDLFLKLESDNPGGSIKDRIGLSMIQDAQARGVIKPGYTLVEGTAGNTGIALALVGKQLGYKVLLVVPDKMSSEKIATLSALGAEVVLTRSDVERGHPEYYQDMAKTLAEGKSDHYFTNQFANAANPLAHETTTGPEILEQMGGKVDAVFCGVGSGGTVTGLSRFFKREYPACEIVVADPNGSIIAPYIATGTIPSEVGSWLVEGIGEDFLPDIIDLSNIKKAYSISDKESFDAANLLLATNGIMCGPSSGTLLAAALKYCKEQKTKKRVVTLVCDSGSRYVSKLFSKSFRLEEGIEDTTDYNDLRDFVFRPHGERATITLNKNESLLQAFKRMRSFAISQLPVIEGNHVVGLIDESDILREISKDSSALSKLVGDVMTTELSVLNPSDSIEQLGAILEHGKIGLIVHDGVFFGLVTKTDYINRLLLRARHKKS